MSEINHAAKKAVDAHGAMRVLEDLMGTRNAARLSGPHVGSDRMEIDEMREALRSELLEGAWWRRAKAEQFPDDHRNLPAADLLERIASTVDDVPDALMRQYGEAWDPDISARTSEAQSVLMRDIGFRSATDNATKLIEHLLDHVADIRSDRKLG